MSQEKDKNVKKVKKKKKRHNFCDVFLAVDPQELRASFQAIQIVANGESTHRNHSWVSRSRSIISCNITKLITTLFIKFILGLDFIASATEEYTDHPAQPVVLLGWGARESPTSCFSAQVSFFLRSRCLLALCGNTYCKSLRMGLSSIVPKM